MTGTSERRRRFRAILAGDACIHPGSVFDPLSARIAQEIGFECGMFAGSTASLAVLGAPDLILVTLTEFAEQARRIGRAARALPLLVDADHGYGNALNAMRTVEELEVAGVAGLTIEDTLLPRPFGDGAVTLLPLREGLGKLRAALAARDDPALCVIARTSAVNVNGLDDAVERTRAYTESGADALFYTGVDTLAQLDAIARVATRPIVLGGSGKLGREELAARGVRIALQGHAPIQAAAEAVRATLQALRDGAPVTGLPAKADWALATRTAEYEAWTREFLQDGEGAPE